LPTIWELFKLIRDIHDFGVVFIKVLLGEWEVLGAHMRANILTVEAD